MSIEAVGEESEPWPKELIPDSFSLDQRIHKMCNSTGFFETIGRELIEKELLDPTPVPDRATPELLCIEGWIRLGIGIGGINGIGNSKEEALQRGQYLQSFAQGAHIDWIYSPSDGKVVDVATALLFNYRGHSRDTADLLQNLWTDFHRCHLDSPQAKYLQFCHSRGAIDVRNALQLVSQEIRDRIIVVTIAPAAIVPGQLCYRSYNYASEKDLVPKGELLSALLQDLSHPIGVPWKLIEAARLQKQLTILPAHAGASGIDHDFLSATFQEIIQKHITAYLLAADRAPFLSLQDPLGVDHVFT